MPLSQAEKIIFYNLIGTHCRNMTTHGVPAPSYMPLGHAQHMAAKNLASTDMVRIVQKPSVFSGERIILPCDWHLFEAAGFTKLSPWQVSQYPYHKKDENDEA